MSRFAGSPAFASCRPTVLAAVPLAASAAPEEVQVYRDEVTALHRFSVEVNQSYVAAEPVRGHRADQPGGPLSPDAGAQLRFRSSRLGAGGLIEVTLRNGGALMPMGSRPIPTGSRRRPEGQAWYLDFNGEVG